MPHHPTPGSTQNAEQDLRVLAYIFQQRNSHTCADVFRWINNKLVPSSKDAFGHAVYKPERWSGTQELVCTKKGHPYVVFTVHLAKKNGTAPDYERLCGLMSGVTAMHFSSADDGGDMSPYTVVFQFDLDKWPGLVIEMLQWHLKDLQLHTNGVDNDYHASVKNVEKVLDRYHPYITLARLESLGVLGDFHINRAALCAWLDSHTTLAVPGSDAAEPPTELC